VTPSVTILFLLHSFFFVLPALVRIDANSFLGRAANGCARSLVRILSNPTHRGDCQGPPGRQTALGNRRETPTITYSKCRGAGSTQPAPEHPLALSQSRRSFHSPAGNQDTCPRGVVEAADLDLRTTVCCIVNETPLPMWPTPTQLVPKHLLFSDGGLLITRLGWHCCHSADCPERCAQRQGKGFHALHGSAVRSRYTSAICSASAAAFRSARLHSTTTVRSPSVKRSSAVRKPMVSP
jgi:hypothetical protein